MNTAAADDVALIARTRQGDRRAFAELVRRYQDRVFRFILRMAGSREDAMDLTQETFMKAHQALPEWRPEAKFTTWLFQIARNATLDHLRRRKHEHVAMDEAMVIVDTRPGPEAQLDVRQRYASLEEALRRLPPEHREILLLREVEEMSYDDIAEALGINEGTVKSRLARARTALLHIHQRTEHAHD